MGKVVWVRTRAVFLISVLVCLGCQPASERVRLYHVEEFAPSVDPEDLEALDWLGPKVVDQGVQFSVYSENASAMRLLLFDDPEAERPSRKFDMTRRGDQWSLYVEGIGPGQHYGLVSWGPNWPYDERWFPGSVHGFLADVDDGGHRFNPNKLLIDPYARAIHRDHDWSRASTASGPARTQSTFAAASKSLVVKSDYVWSANETRWREGRRDGTLEGHGDHELIVYEVHLKGFTADRASGVSDPGTYLGVAEKAAYLADLGVTAVEFLPLHEKPLDGGYWGYNNLSFFALENTFSTNDEPLAIVDEFKEMVDILHQHGIEVLVDVVYNHTGEGGLWREKIEQDDTTLDQGTATELVNFDPHEVAGIYSFRGLDNASYYALSADGLTYWNNTGVGNQTRSNHRPMRRLTMDSLRYMVDELHVDGFRFDLAPVLGEKDGFYNTWATVEETVLYDIITDPVLVENRTRVIAEPWSLAGFYLGQFPATDELGWGEWNAHFRDWWRSFLHDDDWTLNRGEGPIDGGGALTGSYDLFAASGRKPYHSVNFVTVHDGFTLYDLVSYDEKRNSCGPLNPVCCDAPNSPWCDRDSGENHNRSRNWGDEEMKRQMMRNFFVAMLVSQGTPLLLGGDEWMRTQLGNNNAYSTGSDNEYNWFQWGNWQAKDEAHRMHDFVRSMIRLRKERLAHLSPPEYGVEGRFAWKSVRNDDAVDWGSRQLMLHYYDDKRGPELLVLMNMEADWLTFSLPADRNWRRLVDTQAHFDSVEFLGDKVDERQRSHNIELQDPELLSEGEYSVAARSIVILEESP
jgi:isoamylase